MKHSLCLFFFSTFFFPVFSQSQGYAFTFKGKIHQLSSFSSFLTAYPGMAMDTIPIQADGSFSYSGSFSEPGQMQIGTRKSGIVIWLDTCLKNVYLSEKPDRNGKLKLTIDSVLGSEDTYLHFRKLLPTEGVVINNNSFSGFSIPYSQMQNKFFLDSLRKAIKPTSDSLRNIYFFHKIDSVFKIRSDSKVLPWLISFYSFNLGINFMQELYYRLNTEQQQSQSGKDLLTELNRLQILKPGIIFGDFAMKDDHAKDFKLSSLKSKYILINFWASWCGPCRSKHPYLREAYQKTKGSGLEIVSISLDEDRQKWLEAIKQDKLNWINVSDLIGVKNDLALKYKISGVPFSVLLDENRKVVLVDPSSYQITDFFANLR